ncbi:MAG: DUF4827 domain-containing protein [Prevotella sp.]|nr:DUF4827 domain-containing protein [Prevotella sp.]
MTNKSLLWAIPLLAILFLNSCSHYETYAEQKEKETKAVRQFLADRNINVISEAEFHSNGRTTDVSKNEYVLFASSGVYMQIVRQGCGSIIKDGETCTVLCRFSERNILTDSLILTNDVLSYSSVVDKMSVRRTSDTFTASFIAGESLMYTAYGSASVPPGWLAPLLYINVGRPEKDGDEIAKVNLIVPSAQGTQSASSAVYPCFYTITYEKGI